MPWPRDGQPGQAGRTAEGERPDMGTEPTAQPTQRTAEWRLASHQKGRGRGRGRPHEKFASLGAYPEIVFHGRSTPCQAGYAELSATKPMDIEPTSSKHVDSNYKVSTIGVTRNLTRCSEIFSAIATRGSVATATDTPRRLARRSHGCQRLTSAPMLHNP